MSNAPLPPFVYWRDGRPRFIPGARERGLGFAGADLKTGDAWMSFEQAAAWGTLRYGEIVAARARGRKAAPSILHGASVEDLLNDFLAAMARGEPGPKGHPLSVDGIASYRKAADAIIYQPQAREQAAQWRARRRAADLLGQPLAERAREKFAQAPAASVGKVELNDFFLYALEARGHHMALSMVAVFSAAYTWGGTAARWRLGRNPRYEIKFARPEGRIVIIEAHELAAFIAAADASGRASIGDALLLGVDTGQRQRDRLLMVDEGLFDGRRRFRQSKTRMVVEIKETRRLSLRLADAKARTAALKLKFGTRENAIVLDEHTGLPYDSTTYRHTVAQVRDLAWRGSNELALPPCPSLRFLDERTGEQNFKTDQDTRDTCVTRLYRATCTILEICDITGHTYKSAQTIINHYLARDRARADAAIDKLEAWMDREAAG